jgi:hypothetical protein
MNFTLLLPTGEFIVSITEAYFHLLSLNTNYIKEYNNSLILPPFQNVGFSYV